ncbi:MAG: type IV secretory system conjugative DNA transfer family protein [Cetobacterium sp.]|nr:type IV secretory system conjugative DNA transfer family protein [Cetobacterium sp.]
MNFYRVRRYLIITIGYFLFLTWGTTQYIGYKLNYHKDLKNIIYSSKDFKIYKPINYFIWKKKYAKKIPRTLKEADNIFLAGSIFFLIGILLIFKKQVLDSHGTAKWATKDDLKTMNVYNKQGVVLGCDKQETILRTNGVEHILLTAGTRQGKGINTAVPTCLDWQGSMIISDMKGELWGLTAGYRKQVLGQKVLMFNPIDDTGKGCGYNPLDFVRLMTDFERTDVEAVIITIVDTDGKIASDHWVESACNFLIGVVLHVMYVTENPTLTDVMDFLTPVDISLMDQIADLLGKPREGEEESRTNKFNHTNYVSNKDIFKEIYGKDVTFHPKVAEEFTAILNTPEEERGSIISTAKKKMRIFTDPLIKRNIKKSSFTIKEIMEKKVTLYLVIPPEGIDRCAPLLRILITQTVYGLTKPMKFDNKMQKWFLTLIAPIKEMKEKIENKIFKKPQKNRILLLLDEFPSFGNLSYVERAMSYIAGFGIKVLLITQSLKQLEKIYGKANFFRANCSIQIYLTPNEIDDAEAISRALGTKTVRDEQKTRTGFGFISTRSETFHGRPLKTAGEVMTLPYEEILLFVTGKNPVLGKKLFYYKRREYKNKLYPTPEKSDTMEELANEEE